MPPELIGRVFDLFVQGERTLAREQGGFGIGLTMVKRLVELHGGTVQAKAKARIMAPRSPSSCRRLSPLNTHRSCNARDQTAMPRQILIIEDDDDARDSLAELLRLDGHQVTVASNGTEESSWRLVNAGVCARRHRPAGIDGYEVARRLRNNPATSRLRLVAVTGYGTQEDRRSALAAGFDEHLAKPVEFTSLQALLSEA